MWGETSAKTGEGVSEIFTSIGKSCSPPRPRPYGYRTTMCLPIKLADSALHSQETPLDRPCTYSSWRGRRRTTSRPTGCRYRSQQVRRRRRRARRLSMLSLLSYWPGEGRGSLSMPSPHFTRCARLPACSYTDRSFLSSDPATYPINANPRIFSARLRTLS
jgi:hypothetical protein